MLSLKKVRKTLKGSTRIARYARSNSSAGVRRFPIQMSADGFLITGNPRGQLILDTRRQTR
jgi:hypothetical protein